MPYKLQIISYDKKLLSTIEEPLRHLLSIYLRSWNVSLDFESKILSKFRFLKKKRRFTVIRSPHIFKKSQEHFTQEQWALNINFNLFNFLDILIQKKLIFILIKELNFYLPAACWMKLILKKSNYLNI